MLDGTFAGLKIGAPKIVAGGGMLGLPITAAVGPVFGMIALGAFGVICISGYLAAIRTVQNRHPATSQMASVPAL